MEEAKLKAVTREGIASVITGLAGVVGVWIAIYAVWTPQEKAVAPTETAFAQSQAEMQALRRDVTRLNEQQQVIRHALARAPENLQSRLLAERLQNSERRQARIEQAILNNPVRALELPLLRNDLNNAKEANAQSLAAIKASVDQVYDLNKWLLGGMAIAIIALAVSSFLTKKEK